MWLPVRMRRFRGTMNWVAIGSVVAAGLAAMVEVGSAPATALPAAPIVVVSTTTLPPNRAIAEAMAHCPSGYIAIGGGFDTNGSSVFVVSDGPRLVASDSSVHDLEFFPSGTYAPGNVWEAVGYNVGSTAAVIATSATCVPATGGPTGQVKVVVTTTTGNATGQRLTASCPPPYEAIGGGVDVQDENNQDIIDNQPIGSGPATGWEGMVSNAGNFTGAGSVGVICADQVDAGLGHFSLVTKQPPGSPLSCPNGSTATAAGLNDLIHQMGPLVNGQPMATLGPSVSDNQFAPATTWAIAPYLATPPATDVATVLCTPTTSSTTSVLFRIAGADRFLTAVAASQARFAAGSAGSVVLVRSDGFADALAGTPLAVSKKGPLLLTPSASLDPRTEAEIKRVLPGGATVYVLGGTSAVSGAVVAALTTDGYSVTRIGGVDRYDTAVKIAAAIGTPAAILLATGVSPGDALAGGAAAAKLKGVVVLTSDSTMPPETSTYLGANTAVPVYALGGPAAAADPAATPIVGVDRYDTSVQVARKFFTSPTAVGLANGFAFADALSGGAAIGTLGGPLVLVDPSILPASVHLYLVSIHAGVTRAEVYGGTATVPESEFAAIGNALAGN